MQIVQTLQVVPENFLSSQVGFNEGDLIQMTELSWFTLGIGEDQRL